MLKGFVDFVRKQGVIGLAVGFILGGSVQKVVSSLVTDLVNPLLGIPLGSASDLASASASFAGATFRWGSFVSVLIDFTVVALIVYAGVHGMGLDKLDKKD
jgi:large conductance mechanosensitive channel